MSDRITDDPSTPENEDQMFNGKKDDNSLFAVLGILAVIFLAVLPVGICVAAIITLGLWISLRYIRLRISMVALIASLLSVLSAIVIAMHIGAWMISTRESMPAVMGVWRSSVPFLTKWGAIVHPLMWTAWIFAIIGCVIGCLMAGVSKTRIARNPQLVFQKDEKYSGFRYRLTPRQVLQRRRYVKSLKNGTFVPKGSHNNDAFGLGIEEEPINPPDDIADIVPNIPISRYDDEAVTHTIINGQTGSGKDVRYDTLLPTPDGMKTAENVQVGDVLFDENGQETTVLAKYHPDTPDHYNVIFSDGTVVKTGGDHLWSVLLENNKEAVKNTRDMYNGMHGDIAPQEYSIPATKCVSYTSKKLTNIYKYGKSIHIKDDIPNDYLIGSKNQRLEFIAGVTENGVVSVKSKIAAQKIRQVICSLGLVPTKISMKNELFTFSFDDHTQRRYITDIVPIDDDSDYYCFTVDSPNHLFLCSESFIPTHNTISMQNIIRHDMENNRTIFIIDCKNDPKFAAKMSAWSNELGKKFYHFAPEMADEYRIQDNPSGPCFYDPLAHGNAATHTDMLISTREWDANSAFYKQSAQSFLSTVFAVMQEMNPNDKRLAHVDTHRGSMYTFYELVRDESNLMNAIMTIPSDSQTRLLADEMITSLKAGRTDEAKNIRKAMIEYKGQMRGLMSSIGRYMVSTHDPKRKTIDIFKLAAEDGNVVLFSLNATKNTDMGVLVGSMICTDLTNMTGSRAISGQMNPVSIYVDEFQSLPPNAVKSMLEKARSANISITIAFQSMQQVSAASGNDALVNSLMDTCNNFIFHAGANETTAEMMSKIIGQGDFTDFTLLRRNQQGIFNFNFKNRRNMNTQKKQIRRYTILPSVFQNLTIPKSSNGYKAEAIVIKKSSSDSVDGRRKEQKGSAAAHKVWMIPSDEVVKDDYFDPTSPIMKFDDNPPETGLHDDEYGNTVSDDDGGNDQTDIHGQSGDLSMLYTQEAQHQPVAVIQRPKNPRLQMKRPSTQGLQSVIQRAEQDDFSDLYNNNDNKKPQQSHSAHKLTIKPVHHAPADDGKNGHQQPKRNIVIPNHPNQ